MTKDSGKKSLTLAYCSFSGVIIVIIVFPMIVRMLLGDGGFGWAWFPKALLYMLEPRNLIGPIFPFAGIAAGVLGIKYGQEADPAAGSKIPKIGSLFNSIVLLFVLYLALFFYVVTSTSRWWNGVVIYLLSASLLGGVGVLGMIAGVQYGREIQPIPKAGFMLTSFFSALTILLLAIHGTLELYPIYRALPEVISMLISAIGICGTLTAIQYGRKTKFAHKTGFAVLGVWLNSIILLFSLGIAFMPKVVKGEIMYQENAASGNYICVAESIGASEEVAVYTVYFEESAEVYEQHGDLPWERKRVNAGSLSVGQIVVARLGISCNHEWACVTAKKIIILQDEAREWQFQQYKGDCSTALGTF